MVDDITKLSVWEIDFVKTCSTIANSRSSCAQLVKKPLSSCIEIARKDRLRAQSTNRCKLARWTTKHECQASYILSRRATLWPNLKSVARDWRSPHCKPLCMWMLCNNQNRYIQNVSLRLVDLMHLNAWSNPKSVLRVCRPSTCKPMYNLKTLMFGNWCLAVSSYILKTNCWHCSTFC